MLSTNKSIEFSFVPLVPLVVEWINWQESWWINKRFSCIEFSNQFVETEQGKILISDTKTMPDFDIKINLKLFRKFDVVLSQLFSQAWNSSLKRCSKQYDKFWVILKSNKVCWSHLFRSLT